MTTSNLLLDPLLLWYRPKDLVSLQQINKEHYECVKSFLKNETRYEVIGAPFDSWQTRMRLYQMYPNIQKLTIDVHHPYTVKDYLRPSLQSLHLILPLQFGEDLGVSSYRLDNLRVLSQAFTEIQEFLQGEPRSQLKELILSFSPTIGFLFIYPRSYIVDYDRFGPIYEEAEVFKSSTTLSPSHCLQLLHDEDSVSLQDSFLSVAQMPNWKSIQIPYHFPGAESIPKATYTDICDIDTQTLEDLQHDILYLRERKN